jgi:hypothetical protein
MKLLIYFSLFLFSQALFAKDAELFKFYNNHWQITNKSIEYIKNGEILAESTVDSHKRKIQSFKMNIAAMHKRSCPRVLRKLSMYENYSDWISFIKSSQFDEKNKLLTIKADHTLLPFPMIVHILVKRATTQGKYDFSFPTGMFKGLKGKFIIKQHKAGCAFYADSKWRGKDTKIPNFVIELFSETLTKMAGDILFRKFN